MLTPGSGAEFAPSSQGGQVIPSMLTASRAVVIVTLTLICADWY
jgi:hypothetical protein